VSTNKVLDSGGCGNLTGRSPVVSFLSSPMAVECLLNTPGPIASIGRASNGGMLLRDALANGLQDSVELAWRPEITPED
jgi:hypothetical protein